MPARLEPSMTAIDTHSHGHDHDHPEFLAHHWESPQQQFEAGKLGMWLFLATEFLLFAGLFCAYAVFRFNHPELFAYGSQFLDTTWGAINTVVLILSSLTMALAVSAAQLGKKRALVTLLGLTFLGGLGFMVIKYIEYSAKFEHNFVWGTGLYQPTADEWAAMGHEAEEAVQAVPETPMGDEINGFMIPVSAVPPAATGPAGLAASHDAEHHEEDGAAHDDAEHHDDEHASHYPDVRGDVENRPANAHLFFGIYFCMTGLHGVHVLAGMGVIAWLMIRSARGEFSAEYFTPVDLGGLYWHVVDLIWIFLFPLLYLI
jgi:cytochrome c oxidase subunit 3